MNTRLTAHQKQVFEKIKAFTTASGAHVFVLKGFAGTGKTFLLRAITDELGRQKRAFFLMAPTGRAARMICSRTGLPAATIHRSIYRFQKEGLDNREMYRVEYLLAENNDPDDAVYIIDEASMIADLSGRQEMLRFGSGQLLSDLIQYVLPKQTRRKIIFCGDTAQLPPVGMDRSPALDAARLSSRFGLRCETACLSQVLRQQQGNSVLRLATELRNQLSKAVPEQVYIGADGLQVGEMPEPQLQTEYAILIRKQLFPDMIWICHSNRAAQAVNENMRGRLGFMKNSVEDNELLMVSQNNYANEMLLMNGDHVRVRAASDRTESFEVVFRYRGGEVVQKKLVFRDVSLIHPSAPDKLIGVKLLENSLREPDIGKLRAALFVLCRNQYKTSGMPTDFESFKHTNPYIRALFARYGYAITCHKAQGGEWRKVIADFNHCAGVLTQAFLRWAYTAVSRAEQQLWVVHPVSADALSGFVVHQISLLQRVRVSVPPEHLPEPEADAPEVFHRFPFLVRVQNILTETAGRLGIQLHIEYEIYRIRIAARGDTMTCRWELHYNNHALQPEPQHVTATHSQAFIWAEKLTRALCNPSGEAEIRLPEEPFRLRMFMLLKQCCVQAGIRISGLIEDDGCDTWLLETDKPGAELACYYDSSKRFTTVEPASVWGGRDKKLVALTRMLSNRTSVFMPVKKKRDPVFLI